jgi:hypothetical protein
MLFGDFGAIFGLRYKRVIYRCEGLWRNRRFLAVMSSSGEKYSTL